MVILADTDAQRCYNSTNTENCGPFATSTINWTTNWDKHCPFDESMCIGPAMQMDSGAINSNAMLGLNSSPEEQIELRKVSTCAPITQDQYTNTTGGTSYNELLLPLYPLPGEEFVQYWYGSYLNTKQINKLYDRAQHIRCQCNIHKDFAVCVSILPSHALYLQRFFLLRAVQEIKGSADSLVNK